MDLSFLKKEDWLFPLPFRFLFPTDRTQTQIQTNAKEAPPPPPPPPSSPSPPRRTQSLLLAATNIVSVDLRPLARSLRSFQQRTSPPQSQTSPPRKVISDVVGCDVTPRFRPYVAKVPWHGGVRAFLSQLFPRYGHYCGPNWSSGKDGGSMLWDMRPIDSLDLCCYCHDIGYDTHDQAKLLKADLAFLRCLERPQLQTKGDARAAELYKSMCIAGLRNILIPYRTHLVRLRGMARGSTDEKKRSAACDLDSQTSDGFGKEEEKSSSVERTN